jgi:hypothetical protein
MENRIYQVCLEKLNHLLAIDLVIFGPFGKKLVSVRVANDEFVNVGL